MNPQEPHQESWSSLRPVPSAGLRGVLVVERPGHAPSALERAAFLPLAPGARVAMLRSVAPPRGGHGGTGSPGSPEALLETGVRAMGGQFLQLDMASDEELLATVDEATQRHDLELVVVAREPDSLRARLFGSLPQRLARYARLPTLVSQLPARQYYQRILVATDFSPVSRAALELALRLGTPGSSELVVFHAYDTSYALTLRQTPASAGTMLHYYQRSQAQAEATMREFLAPFRGAPMAPRPIVSGGVPQADLHKVACAQDAELVVVGRNGARGAGHALLGSVAEATLRRRHRYDVLVVPSPTVH